MQAGTPISRSQPGIAAGEVRSPRHVYPASELATKMLCVGFKRKKWASHSRSVRRMWRILHSITVTNTIVDFSSRGYRFLRIEEPSGSYGGRVDIVFEDAEGRIVKVEVSGSSYLKDHKVIQGVLYHEPSDRIAIASLNETVEPDPWLVEALRTVASKVERFLQEHPEQAARIFTPCELCPDCSSEMCSRSAWKCVFRCPEGKSKGKRDMSGAC
jgi:hypothetical protein